MDVYEWRFQVLSFLERFHGVTGEFFPADVGQVMDLTGRLRARRFLVALVGQGRPGKSALLDALLEQELVPVRPVPLPFSVRTRVRDGADARVTWKVAGHAAVHLYEGRPRGAQHVHDLLRERLADTNARPTQALSASRGRGTCAPQVTIEVQYPLKSGRGAVDWIEGHGAGPLPDLASPVDVVIVVLSAIRPPTVQEADAIRDHWGKRDLCLLFALNQIDRLANEREREEIEALVSSRLERALGKRPVLYALSAHLALRGVQWRDRTVDWDEVLRQEREMRFYPSHRELLDAGAVQPLRRDVFKALDRRNWMTTEIASVLEQAEDRLVELLRRTASDASVGSYRALESLGALVRAHQDLLDPRVVKEATMPGPKATVAHKTSQAGKSAVLSSRPPVHDLARRHRHTLDERFDESELRTLCFELAVDYDNLWGQTKSDKARELVAYLERHERLQDLVEAGKRLRPDVRWE